MSRKKRRVDLAEPSGELGSNPFEQLSAEGLASGPARLNPPSDSAEAPNKRKRSRGRVDVCRQKAGRGGKTVTIASGFVGIGAEEKQELAKRVQRRCGVGGGVKNGAIEIQGDKREELRDELEEAGFKVVFTGG